MNRNDEIKKIKELRAKGDKKEQFFWLMANCFPSKENGGEVYIYSKGLMPMIANDIDGVFFNDEVPMGWDIYVEMIKDVYIPYFLQITAVQKIKWKSGIISAFAKEQPGYVNIPATITLTAYGETQTQKVFLVDERITSEANIKEETDEDELEEYFDEDGNIDWDKWPYAGEIRSTNQYYVGDWPNEGRPRINLTAFVYSEVVDTEIAYILQKDYPDLSEAEVLTLKKELESNAELKSIIKGNKLTINEDEDEDEALIDLNYEGPDLDEDNLEVVDSVFDKIVALVDYIIAGKKLNSLGVNVSTTTSTTTPTKRFINDDFKLKNGGRKAPKISEDELRAQFAKVMHTSVKNSPQFDSECLEYIQDQIYTDGTTINKDCKYEIGFDNEDYCGFNTLSNGLAVFEFAVCGDEDLGYVYNIVYWDGKKLRLFQPTYGNLVDTDARTAISGIDGDEYIDQYGFTFEDDIQFDLDAVTKEIEARIVVS